MKPEEVLNSIEQLEWVAQSVIESLRIKIAGKKFANRTGEELLKELVKKKMLTEHQSNAIQKGHPTGDKADRQHDSKPAESVSSASTDAADMLPPAPAENEKPTAKDNASVVTKDCRIAATDTSASPSSTKAESSPAAQAARQAKQSTAKTVQAAKFATQPLSTASPRQSQKQQGSRQQSSPPVVNPTAARAKRIDEPVERVLDAAARLKADPVFAGAPVSSPVKTRNQSALEQRRGRSRRRLRLPLPAVFCFLLVMGLSCLAVFNTQRIGLLEQQLASGEAENGLPGKPLDGDDTPDDGSKSFKKRSPDDVKAKKPTKKEKPVGNEASAADKKILAEVNSLQELIKRLEDRIGGLENRVGGYEAALDELRVKLGEHKVRLPGSELALRFVVVPTGSFTFGYSEQGINELFNVFKQAGEENPFAGHNARPAVTVKVTREFFVLEHEVTRGQFAAFQKQSKKGIAKGGKPVASKKEVAGGANDLMPQTEVTWREAREFCKWIGELTKRQVRLPTEIEWEYAARGREARAYPWKGEEFHAWAGKNASDAGPRPVNAKGNKDVSWRGVFDMSGNVSEWCLDRYEKSLHGTLTNKIGASKQFLYDPNDNIVVKDALKQDPTNPRPFRTYRGGAYKDHPGQSQVSGRRSLQEIKSSPAIGFRPVLLLAPRSSGN